MSAWVEAVAWWRYALLFLALAWALASLRWRVGPSTVTLGLLFVAVATLPFGLGLARPYGLFEDPAATRRLGELQVAAVSGTAGSVIAGEPAEGFGSSSLLRVGLPPALLTTLGRFAPGLAVAATGLAVLAFWSRREAATVAAILVWLASSGDLDGVRGVGFLAGSLARPEASLGLPLLVALTLLAARLPGVFRFVAVAVPWPALGALGAPREPLGADVLLLLTLDASPWILLAAFALRREREVASLALTAGGASLVLLSSLPGSAVDPVIGHALFRVGVLLAAALALVPLLVRLGVALMEHRPIFFAGKEPASVGLAVCLAIFAPASFLAWWDPVRTDPVYRLSLEPVSPALDPVLAFIRAETPTDAVFVASPDYAPVVAALGGRRVLRAPSLLTPADDAQRRRAERAILEGRAVPPGAEAHGARFVLIAPGDFKSYGITRPEDLESRPRLARRYADDAGYRVYEYSR